MACYGVQLKHSPFAWLGRIPPFLNTVFLSSIYLFWRMTLHLPYSTQIGVALFVPCSLFVSSLACPSHQELVSRTRRMHLCDM
jgi:hypothetical protein